jgi:hypothetical protein
MGIDGLPAHKQAGESQRGLEAASGPPSNIKVWVALPLGNLAIGWQRVISATFSYEGLWEEHRWHIENDPLR